MTQSLKFSRRKLLNYTLTIFFIFISGNPFFKGELSLIILFVFASLIFINRIGKISNGFKLFFSLIILITILQSFKFSFFPIITYLGFYIKIVTSYLIIRILGLSFTKYYVKTIIFISSYSLFLYLISNINVNLLLPFSLNTSGFEKLYPRYSFLSIFTFIPGETLKNAGPLWEGGAYCGYLVLALIFNYFSDIKGKNKRQLLLIISIVTTFSTTGYISTFIFFFLVKYKEFKSFFVKILFVIIFVWGGYLSFTNFSFLGEKIKSQISVIDDDPYFENTNSQRFLNVIRDYKDFEGHELIGRGMNNKTRYLYDIEGQIRTVGITDIIVKMGLPFFILLVYMLINSIRSFITWNSKNNSLNLLAVILSVFCLLFSQVYLNYSLFWSLFFLGYVYKKKNKQIL